jgi:hypothetical protein
MRWMGHVAPMTENRNVYKILVRKSEVKCLFGRPWLVDTRTDHEGTKWKNVDWIDLAQDSDQWRVFVNTVMNLRAS